MREMYRIIKLFGSVLALRLSACADTPSQTRYSRCEYARFIIDVEADLIVFV